mmetsp:Transcript_14606/g.42714  ORF Transcript_14606/g.42714 Transcript_14606/m.42714 type:complete len:240 (-) Transcript_14606:1056-1775(-)
MQSDWVPAPGGTACAAPGCRCVGPQQIPSRRSGASHQRDECRACHRHHPRLHWLQRGQPHQDLGLRYPPPASCPHGHQSHAQCASHGCVHQYCRCRCRRPPSKLLPHLQPAGCCHLHHSPPPAGGGGGGGDGGDDGARPLLEHGKAQHRGAWPPRWSASAQMLVGCAVATSAEPPAWQPSLSKAPCPRQCSPMPCAPSWMHHCHCFRCFRCFHCCHCCRCCRCCHCCHCCHGGHSSHVW